jgi:alkylhydroperoxidase family enzyme
MEDYRKAPITPDMKQLLSFAEKVARDATDISPEDIKELRSAGWSDRAVLDAAHVAGFFCYINRVVQALGGDIRATVPMDEDKKSRHATPLRRMMHAA